MAKTIRRNVFISLVLGIAVSLAVTYFTPNVYRGRAVIVFNKGYFTDASSVNLPKDLSEIMSKGILYVSPMNHAKEMSEIINKGIVLKYLEDNSFGVSVKARPLFESLDKMEIVIDARTTGIQRILIELLDYLNDLPTVKKAGQELEESSNGISNSIERYEKLKAAMSVRPGNVRDAYAVSNLFELEKKIQELSSRKQSIDYIIKKGAFEVFEPMKVDGARVKPNVNINILLGALIGICVGAIISLLQEYIFRKRGSAAQS